MNLTGLNFSAVLPVIVLVSTGMAIMVIDPFLIRTRRIRLQWLALSGTVAAALAMVPMAGNRGLWYSGLWQVDDYSLFFHSLLLLIAGLTILASMSYLLREDLPPSEFAALVLFATTGALLMVGSDELLLTFVGIEILSMGTYVLAGYRRTEIRSNESGLKYFLLGSFASAFFLYGVALALGGSGTTRLSLIGAAVANGSAHMNLIYAGSALMLVGLAFKVALAPFHVWAPDVYEGAPIPVTAFMSVGPKAAGFAVLIRLLQVALPGIEHRWIWVLWALAALTMIVGNIVALIQPGIKRMLAYSSIAHAGYVAVALASGFVGTPAALFYLLAYAVTNLGAFAVVVNVSRPGEDGRSAIEDYRGLGWQRPGLAAVLSLYLLSLAGIPATAGFTGKLLIFRAAVGSGLTGLAVLGVLTTAVSFYYYLYVIVEMYMREPVEAFSNVRLGATTIAVLVVTAALTLYLGLLPEGALEWANRSALDLLANR